MADHNIVNQRQVAPPHKAGESLRNISATPPETLKAVVTWMTNRLLPLSTEDCANAFKKEHPEISESNGEISGILYDLFTLLAICRAYHIEGSDLIDRLSEDRETKEDDSETITDDGLSPEALENLVTFLNDESIGDTVAKTQTIYEGFASNFQGVSSLVEFRPIFTKDESSLMGGLICGSLKIVCREPFSDEPDEAFFCQVDAEDIDKIEIELDRLKKKLSAMKKKTREWEILLANPTKSV